MIKRRVALVTQDLVAAGGVATMTAYLYSVLQQSGEWHPEIISLATSANDDCSTRISRPASWLNGVQVDERNWRGLDYLHVGARFVELEPQRHRPRPVLDALLNQYDVIQFVAGSAAPVCVARNVRKPRLLWTATTVRADRASRLRASAAPRRIWSTCMLRWTERQERHGLRCADAIFALSEYTRGCLRPLINGRRVEVAPCGVDTELFRPGSPDGDYIICVARFHDARKNVHLLLRAYALLRDRLGNCPRLCLVGDLPNTNAQQLLTELGIGQRVDMIGAQAPARLSALYRAAKAFALSSDEEGLGIVIIEAMASGLPVISTACGGPAMLIEHERNGFLTPVGNAEALASALQRTLEYPRLARQMGMRSRILAEERYSRQATGSIFLDRYHELLEMAPACRS